MRKKFLHTIMVVLSLFCLNSINAEERTLTVDGTERLYQIFYPEKYSVTNEKPYDMLFIMHPNGFSVADFISISNPQAISDINNVIVIYPQATDEQNEEIISLSKTLTSLGIELAGFSTTAVWNSGASISADVLKELAGSYGSMLSILLPNTMAKGKMVFNENVDDVKFIDELVNLLVTKENGNKDGIYMVGASLGGAMTYKYAFLGENSVKAIAVINGFIGKEISIPETISFPVCVFHSEADSIVQYNGGSINDPIELTVETLAKKGGFSGTSKTTAVKDIANDGNKIEKIVYDDGTHPKVHLFKSDKASHHTILQSDYANGPNDIDHIFECGLFFWGAKFGLSVEEIKSMQNITLSPNPATEYIYIPTSGDYEIFNLQGSLISSGTTEYEPIDIKQLQSGNYIVKITTPEGIKFGKVIKK